MENQLEHNVTVTVESQYEPDISRPDVGKYVFSYRVHIHNNSEDTVKLLSRKWHIVSGNGDAKVVEGEGVVGEKPVLHPGSTYVYTSWCPLKFSLGKMYGSYTMQRLKDGVLFDVVIPQFSLVADFVQN